MFYNAEEEADKTEEKEKQKYDKRVLNDILHNFGIARKHSSVDGPEMSRIDVNSLKQEIINEGIKSKPFEGFPKIHNDF